METANSLGQFLREKRTHAQMSLRELAGKAKVSAPFLSDVELGRRNPAPDTLQELAKALKVPLAEFQAFDAREPAADLKRLIERQPAFGLAFRTALDEAAKGNISPEELLRRVSKKR
jgi:transcriptional regulator with XRE-family HTH domain